MTYLLLLRPDFPPKISQGLTRGLHVLRLKRLKLLLVHNEHLLDGCGVEVQVEDVKKVDDFFLSSKIWPSSSTFCSNLLTVEVLGILLSSIPRVSSPSALAKLLSLFSEALRLSVYMNFS